LVTPLKTISYVIFAEAVLKLYVKNMPILDFAKQCTKRFPCRFRVVLIVFAVAVAVSVIAVLFSK